MSQQSFPAHLAPDRLTVAQAFDFLWDHHLGEKPSARPFNSNRKAICRVVGHKWFDELNEPDILKLVSIRSSGSTGYQRVGAQTIKHDLKLITLLYKTMKKWKKKRYALDGFNFTYLRLPEDNPTADIKRPKTRPRKRVLSADEFSLWCEHCPDRLLEQTYFAMDFGMTQVDLEALDISQYNPITDTLQLQRSKTGEVEDLPVTDRCRRILMDRISSGRTKVLDMTNHYKQVLKTRKASGVYFWFGRDLRKTYGNEIRKSTGNDVRRMQRALVHADTRTTMGYWVDDGEDLRPAVKELEKNFSG